MKKFIAMTAIIVSVSAFADTPVPTEHHYFKNNSLQLEMQSQDLNIAEQRINDIKWDFKLSGKTHFNDNLYSIVNVVMQDGNNINYGVTAGICNPYQSLTPYAEISYDHSYKDLTTLSSKQLNYDTGVALNYFSRVSPYVEADDYVDPQKWFVKTGVKFNIDSKFYVLADYAFPSKTTGNKLGFGAGIQF